MSEVTQTKQTVIGIDVSKFKLDICITPNMKVKSIDNNTKSIKKFIRSLLKSHPSAIILMENTGGYEILAQTLFNEADYPVHIAHATRIHYFAKQKGIFAKTDFIDAKTIALYGMQEDIKPSKEIDNASKELKELGIRRAQLVDQLIAEKCRLKDHLSKNMKRSIKRIIKVLENEIKLLEKKMQELVDKSDKMKEKSEILRSFKGVGDITANILLSSMPELGMLNRSQIACLCGVAPQNNDSGTQKGRRKITGGRFYVRKILYMAALSAIRHNSDMKKMYQRLKDFGKESKVAITAVMRKIIVTLNAMVRDGTNWQPST